MTVYIILGVILCIFILYLIKVLFKDLKYNLRPYKRLLNNYWFNKFI